MAKAKTAFISGHVDIDNDTFLLHYKEKIDNAIKNGDNFILGNALGVDTYALDYLLKNINKDRITIYYYSKNPIEKYEKLDVIIKKGFTSYTDRDKNMTLNSDYDIAWIRSIEESQKLYGDKFDSKRKSGTQLNMERRYRDCLI
jgi:hypothetical protein